MSEKSANKLWKESGSNLPFKQWVEMHNASKQNEEQQYFSNLTGENVFQTSIDETKYSLNDSIDMAKKDLILESGYKDTPSSNKVLGLDKNVLIFSTLLISISLGYYFYTKLSKKN